MRPAPPAAAPPPAPPRGRLGSARVEELIPEERIRARVAELGREITRDLAGRRLLVVGVLKGALVFLADLMRAIDLPLDVTLVELSSYAGTASRREIRVVADLGRPLAGADVLVVDDIVDTGRTMRWLVDRVAGEGPASVATCALLGKPARRVVEVPVRYLGFEIPDAFVVGYGLDLDGTLRNLPYVGVMRG